MGRSEYDQVLKIGVTGVDLFFLISGFVIFMSVDHINNAIQFVINRVSRLYPTYWASVTFTFILITIFSIYKGTFPLTGSWPIYLGNLTMFQHYLKIYNLDAPYWTMIVEMSFYILILILISFRLVKYVLPLGVGLLFYSVIGKVYFTEYTVVETSFFWFPVLQFFPLFFAGILFYRIKSGSKYKLLNFCILGFCLLGQLMLYPYVGYSRSYISFPLYTFLLSLYFILFLLFIYGRLYFIVNSITLFLGKISFALYLIHQYFSIGWIIPLFYNNLGLNFWFVTLFINLPLILGVATIITYKIEVPYSKSMKTTLKRVIDRRQNIAFK